MGSIEFRISHLLFAAILTTGVLPVPLLAQSSSGADSEDIHQVQPAFPGPAMQVDQPPFGSPAFEAIDPIKELERWHHQLAQYFSRGFSLHPTAFRPQVDILEKENDYVVHADLPGMKKEEIQIEIAGDQLILSGNRQAAEAVTEENYYRMERSFGEFKRVLTLPENARTDEIEASYDNGVLKIRIPKKAQAAMQARVVPVQ